MKILIKNKEQIDGIRKSCKLSAMTLNYIEKFVVPGITTAEIDLEAERFIRENGGVPAPLGYRGYPRSICASINEVVCHGIPNNNDVLKEGDIVKVDVSTILDGYFGDTCKTFPVGVIKKESQDLILRTQECLNAGIEKVKNGNEFGMIGVAISNHARSNGYSVVYEYVGHGVGIKFHEPPNVNHSDKFYDSTKMKTNMIFTIEPMINCGVSESVLDSKDKWTVRTKDNKLSAQFEHTVLVTDEGFEILTLV